MTQFHRRVSIEIDLKALVHNLGCVRACLPGTKVFSVLKADAYGHNAVVCARVLSESGSDGFAVVFPEEALALRDAGIRDPILVLQGAATAGELEQLAAQDLWMVVHNEAQLKLLDGKASRAPLRVWIKVDTGMGRLGLPGNKLPQLLSQIAALSNVHVMGVLSHLACADNPGSEHTQSQIAAFSALHASHSDALQWSLANSAGVLAWPQSRFDWVRPGIMLYGSNPLEKISSEPALIPVMQVNAPLIALKSCRRGDGIGYSQSYFCPQDMQVGHAAIGYGDGLPRSVSGATVLINGKSAPIIGRVSMDSIAIDLRGVDASVGDTVIIWGKDNPVDDMAKVAETISYELLCSVRGNRTYN